jgi:predicted phosphoadenosine phosphosulfate sulfurtransferase
MRIYTKRSVYEAALDRIRWVFDEFERVVVSVSGGKDSTVLFHLALQVAREKNRLPLPVLWLDQEAEYDATVDIVESWMTHPDVKPLWLQIPFRLSNATSTSEHWLNCWAPEARDVWMRPQHPLAITENRYGTDRFHDLFSAICRAELGSPVACLVGMRADESPQRLIALTHQPAYKWATWGSGDKRKGYYSLSPLYDWTTPDIWHAIAVNDWPYNRVYDALWRLGVPVRAIRVSSLTHELSIHALRTIEAVEPDTYARLIRRLPGIHAFTKLGNDAWTIDELPAAFDSWREYRDYLLENLITNPDWRERMRRMFEADDKNVGNLLGVRLYRAQIAAILTNDWEGTRHRQFQLRNDYMLAREAHRAATAASAASSR